MLLEFIPIRMCKVASYKRFSIWSHWTNITSAIQNDWYISSIHQLYLEDNNKKCNWLAIRNLISIKSSKIKETIFSPIFITFNTIIVTNIYRLLKVVKKGTRKERTWTSKCAAHWSSFAIASVAHPKPNGKLRGSGIEVKAFLASSAVASGGCCSYNGELLRWNVLLKYNIYVQIVINELFQSVHSSKKWILIVR